MKERERERVITRERDEGRVGERWAKIEGGGVESE